MKCLTSVVQLPPLGSNFSVSVMCRLCGVFFTSARPAVVRWIVTLSLPGPLAVPVPVPTVTVLCFLCLRFPVLTTVVHTTLTVPALGAMRLVL